MRRLYDAQGSAAWHALPQPAGDDSHVAAALPAAMAAVAAAAAGGVAEPTPTAAAAAAMPAAASYELPKFVGSASRKRKTFDQPR